MALGYVHERGEAVVRSFSPQDPAAGFTAPHALATVGRFDIAAVAAFKGHVGVLWCHQKAQRLLFRARRDGDPLDQWGPEEEVASGENVANDHINLAADAEGDLWAVTKGQTGLKITFAQLTLRRRNAQGKWDKAIPLLSPPANGTRPVVVLDAEKPVAYVLYTNRVPKPNVICLRRVSLADGTVGEELKVLAADYDLNNATDTKGMVGEASGLMALAGPTVPKAGPARFRLLPLEELR